MFDHSKFNDLLLANSKKSFLISEYRAVDTQCSAYMILSEVCIAEPYISHK